MKNFPKKFKKLLGLEENNWNKKDWFILLVHLWGILAIIMSFLFVFRKLWKIEKENFEEKLLWSKKLENCFNSLGWLIWIMAVIGAWIAVSVNLTERGSILALYGVTYQKIAESLEKRYKSKKEKMEKEMIINFQQEVYKREIGDLRKRVAELEKKNKISYNNQGYETRIEIPPVSDGHLKIL